MSLRNLACLLVFALTACSVAAQPAKNKKNGNPPPPQKTEDQYRTTTDGKSGVEGDFWYQYHPGPAGAKPAPPEKRGGGIVKLYLIEPGKELKRKVLAEGKFKGSYQLTAPAGEYMLEVIFGELDRYEQPVTVKDGKMLKRDLMHVVAAP